MTGLPPSTLRRLKSLPQQTSTWEGDKRPLSPDLMDGLESGTQESGECIVWVDRSSPSVRAMDIVPAPSGMEATVRVLLQAMEHPNSGLPPARPTKLLVKNRELQLFLRGVLKDLDIKVDYSASLPLCDDLFEHVLATADSLASPLPPAIEAAMKQSAELILADEPWAVLDETQILAVELNHSDVETLYVSTLGMAGIDAGLLMYRSADSLRQFRQKVLDLDSTEATLQSAFLDQDCFFLNFRPEEGEFETSFLESEALVPEFGCIHPLEGMRHHLYEEEGGAIILALTALHRFFKKHKRVLDSPTFPELNSRFRVPNPLNPEDKVTIRVSTQIKFALELAQMTSEEETRLPLVLDDITPEKMAYSLGWMPEAVWEIARVKAKVHQLASADFELDGDEFPVFSIQTTRPQAKTMLEAIEAAGGAKSICWVAGVAPDSFEEYDICMLETGNGHMHVLAEFAANDPKHIQAKRQWEQRCKKAKGFCGLIVAMGLSGAKGANQSLKNLMGFYELPSTTAEAQGLGTLIGPAPMR